MRAQPSSGVQDLTWADVHRDALRETVAVEHAYIQAGA